MMTSSISLQSTVALVLAMTLTACSSDDRKRVGQMTSYSTTASASSVPQLFTIPQDQMSHVQVVTVQPTRLIRTLRLTGAVAYNAFNTTPVITQVGGPVSRILVVPGQHVKTGQPMLDVSSPDYSQLLDAYLKAADSFRLADKNWVRAQDLYQHHAIAQRDLEQAESDRNQAQADLNAADQGMRILGIKNPGDLAKAPSSALDSGACTHWGRGRRAPGLTRTGGTGRADASLYDFGLKHRMGAGQRIPGGSGRGAHGR